MEIWTLLHDLNRKDGLNLKNELIFIYILFLQRHSKRNGADVSRNDDDPESTALSKSAFVHVTVRVLVLRVIPWRGLSKVTTDSISEGRRLSICVCFSVYI